jgi:hypothetical protein
MADESKQFVGPDDNAAEIVAPVIEQAKEIANPVINESITMDVFDNLLSGNEDASISKAVEATKAAATELQAKPEEKKPDELKTEPAKVEPKVETKVEDTKTTPKVEPRDYSGIDDTLVPVFKKMGNEFFNNLAPIAKENKRLKAEYDAKVAEAEKFKKNAMPDNYFSHPRGYTLTPDFEIAANTAIKAEQIVNHWETQLKKVEDGDDTYQELHINPSSGEFYLSGPVKADKETPNKLRRIVSGSEQQLATMRNNLSSLATSHTSKYKEAVDAVSEFEKASFSYMDGENKDKLEPIIKDALTKIIPPVFQDSPLARPFVKAIFTIQQLGAQLKLAKESSGTKTPVATEKKVAEDKSKLNPNLSDMSGGSSSSDKQSVASLEALEEVLGKPW